MFVFWLLCSCLCCLSLFLLRFGVIVCLLVSFCLCGMPVFVSSGWALLVLCWALFVCFCSTKFVLLRLCVDNLMCSSVLCVCFSCVFVCVCS